MMAFITSADIDELMDELFPPSQQDATAGEIHAPSQPADADRPILDDDGGMQMADAVDAEAGSEGTDAQMIDDSDTQNLASLCSSRDDFNISEAQAKSLVKKRAGHHKPGDGHFCPICEKRFLQMGGLTRHLEGVHIGPDTVFYQCRDSHYRTTRKSNYERLFHKCMVKGKMTGSFYCRCGRLYANETLNIAHVHKCRRGRPAKEKCT